MAQTRIHQWSDEVDIGSLALSRTTETGSPSSVSSAADEPLRPADTSAGDIGVLELPSRIRPKSQTLPRATVNPLYAPASVLSFTMELEKVRRMQRWIMGLAIGMDPSSYYFIHTAADASGYSQF
jgi:hypothetical protein